MVICRVRGTGHSFHGPGPRFTGQQENAPLTWKYTEPVSGFEPLTCRLQEACSRALGPLPAPMPHGSAAAAPNTRAFPGDPFHDPFHGVGLTATNRAAATPFASVQGGCRGGNLALVLAPSPGSEPYDHGHARCQMRAQTVCPMGVALVRALQGLTGPSPYEGMTVVW